MTVQKGHLLQSPNIIITVDNIPLTDVIAIELSHEINKARILTCTFKGDNSLLMCRLGGLVSFKYHIGKASQSVFTDNSSFLGIIKSISPSNNEHQFIAFDFTTLLAESQFTNYKLEDYIGEDLYFAAASACDYKFQGAVAYGSKSSIDVSNLKSGSGIYITEGMDLFGWKTRKEFIDACFNEMKVHRDDAHHPQFAIQQFYYGIHKDNIMSFFAPDPFLKHPMPVLTLSKDNNNIPAKGVVSQIDTTRLINAITVVSKTDPTLYAQRENAPSIAKHGYVSKFIQHDSTDVNVLDNLAELILRRFNKPSIFYNVVFVDNTNLHLGDLVKLNQPELGIDEILPIVSTKLIIGTEVSFLIKLGEKPLTVQDELDILQRPTNR